MFLGNGRRFTHIHLQIEQRTDSGRLAALRAPVSIAARFLCIDEQFPITVTDRGIRHNEGIMDRSVRLLASEIG